MTELSNVPKDSTPLEYQIFALSLRKKGAIEYFKLNLPEDIVGSIHGEKGINEFYLALLSFYDATHLDIVDPIAFKSWLETDTNIYDALGGNPGVSIMVDILMGIELSTEQSITELIRHKGNKRKQINYLQELQLILTQKGQKTEDDTARIQILTSEIRDLENQIRYNPLDKITTAEDIATRADALLEIPSFLPTQFKALNRAMGYCVDEQTEALTERGWLKYGDIKDVDKILVFDPNTETTKWELPKSYYENYDYDGPMIQLGGGLNSRFDALVTPHHKWIVRYRRSKKLKPVQTWLLPNEGSIPRFASYESPLEIFEDALVELAAWYFTEGSLQKNLTTITIDQSLKINPENVQAIRDILVSLGAKWRKDFKELTTYDKRREGIWVTEYTSKTDCIVFVLTGYGIDELQRIISGPDKVPTSEFLNNLSMRQAQLFVETAMRGDGTPTKRLFYQHNELRMNAYMHAAVLAGYGPNLSSDGTACSLALRHIDLKRISREQVEYSGLIWCPQTEAGYWIARRNGKVYITGNTDKGGFFKGAVHAVIAASGKGKSTFVKCLANHWLDNGYRVLYINFEEATGHWERVLMTQIIEKNVYAEASKWTEEEKQGYLNIFRARLKTWGDRLMIRHDPDTPYFEDLEFWLRDIIGHNVNLPDIVIIDTIQSMFTRGGSKGKPRWGEFEEMMVRLEKLARDMNCALIITAQENANRMKEKREVVQQSDTGGSLTIQQKCAVTIFITEKRLATDDETEDETIMQLQIPKNRITGSTFLYDPPLVKYVDYKKTYEDYDPVTDDSYISSSSLLDDLLNGKDFY